MDTKLVSLIYEKLLKATEGKVIEWTCARPGPVEMWKATNGYVTVTLEYSDTFFSTHEHKLLEIQWNADDRTGSTYERVGGNIPEYDALLTLVRKVAAPYKEQEYIGFPGPVSAVEFLCSVGSGE